MELLHWGVLPAYGEQPGPSPEFHVDSGERSLFLCGLRDNQCIHSWLIVGLLLLYPSPSRTGGDAGAEEPPNGPENFLCNAGFERFL